jgi:hypothetical protein
MIWLVGTSQFNSNSCGKAIGKSLPLFWHSLAYLAEGLLLVQPGENFRVAHIGPFAD